ncbi:hypothetical protein FGIG_03918 [Fasciola gigantica]|uniref:Uncharacterized protein n=1 Tax=Fasciola gigantica TaxID=46835 RepID=A0A504YRV9_FASGI|nr:hypothetical protein FGIG_03918 [Fasciola gigantica]
MMSWVLCKEVVSVDYLFGCSSRVVRMDT